MKNNNTPLRTILHKANNNTSLLQKSVIAVLFLAAASFIYVGLYRTASVEYSPVSKVKEKVSTAVTDEDEDDKKEKEELQISHIETPDSVKAVYMTACAAGTSSFRKNILSLVDDTEINSVVIDIKDYSGTISFSLSEDLMRENEGSQGCRVKDMREFVDMLHDRDVYVIGRITAFQDPVYAKKNPNFAVQKNSDKTVWADNKGISFVDPGTKQFWDYLIRIGSESYKAGFDELNYDYIRYPSDGNMRDIYYPVSDGQEKDVVIRQFFEYLNNQLEETDAIVSADIFGMTTTARNHLNIGQRLEDALATFDYVAPMVYPSHYPDGYQGYGNPAAHPYEIVKYSMGTAVLRAQNMAQSTTTPETIRNHVSKDQLRPWLQDFDLGADYTADMVRAQIQATYDVGLDSWMLWDPRNQYTRGALQKASSTSR